MPDYMSEFNDDFEYKNEPDDTTPDDAENAGISLKNTRLLKRYIEDLLVNGNLVLNVKGIQSINLFDSERFYTEYRNAYSTSVEKTIDNDIEYYKINYNSTPAMKYQFMKGEFKENTQYTFKFIGKNAILGVSANAGFWIRYTDGSASSIVVKSDDEQEYSLISTPKKTIDYISLDGSGGHLFLARNLMIYEGTNDKEYSPYFKI